MTTTPHRLVLAAPLLLLGACADAAPTGPGEAPALKRAPTPVTAPVAVVMSGLNAPKQLAFGPEGALYVAETGTGGSSCVMVDEGGVEVEACTGPTGSVSRLWKGEQERVLTGLPSLTLDGELHAGPADVAFQGRGNMYVTIGLGGDPALRAELGDLGEQLGSLLVARPNGDWRVVADVSAFEAEENPDDGLVDSNPYGLLADRGRQYVTDAGGNSLLEVSPSGDLSLVAAFPDIPTPALPFAPQAVPTEVKRGPDGALYVSTLTGGPFLPGLARIYRIGAGGTFTVYRDGFTAVTDFDFGPDGSLYVLQFASAIGLSGPGSVVRVSPDGATRTTVIGGLVTPTGVAVGHDGAVYVTNMGVFIGAGEVLRVAP